MSVNGIAGTEQAISHQPSSVSDQQLWAKECLVLAADVSSEGWSSEDRGISRNRDQWCAARRRIP